MFSIEECIFAMTFEMPWDSALHNFQKRNGKEEAQWEQECHREYFLEFQNGHTESSACLCRRNVCQIVGEPILTSIENNVVILEIES